MKLKLPTRPNAPVERKPVTRLGLGFDIVMLGAFVWYSVIAFGFSPTARYFPVFVGLLGAALAAANLLVDLRRYRKQERRPMAEETSEVRSSGKYFLWFGGLLVTAYLFSLIPAAAIFLVVFLRTQSKMSWLGTVLVTAGTVGALVVLNLVLDLRMPPGLFFTIG